MPQVTLADLSPIVSEAANDFGVPEESIWRKIRAENSGSVQGAQQLQSVSTDAVSPKNARGIMQMTPVALQDVIEAGLIPSNVSHENMSIRDQIRTGAAYISRLRKYSTDPAVEDAMYNFGPKARFQMDNLPQETEQYLDKTGNSVAVKTGGGPTGTFGNGMLSSDQLIQMLLQSTQQQNSLMAQAGAQVNAANTRATQIQNDTIAAQRVVSDAAAANAGQKAAVTYTANKTIEDLQRLFNMDPTDANNEIATSLTAAQAAKDARVSARAEYDQAAQISPLDDPLGWIMAQVKLPQLAAKNNALADAEDVALQNVNWKTTALNNAKATVTANTADQLKDIQLQDAKLENQKTQLELDNKSAQVSVADAQHRMQQVQIANQIGDNTRSTLVAVTGLQDREEAQAFRMEQKKEILAGKKLKEEEDLRLNNRLADVSKSLGMVEPMTLSRLKTLTNKKQQEAWLNAALTGQMGEDLQDSVYFYLGGANKPAIVAGGGASVHDTAQKLEHEGAAYQSIAERSYMAANPLGKKPTAEESRKMGFKLYQDSIISSMASPTEKNDLSSSVWDKQYNPYVAQFVGLSKAADTLSQYAALKNNSVKIAIDNLMKSGAVKTDNLTSEQQQQVVGSVIQGVLERKMDPKKAAADVSQFFKASAEYNRSLNKYDLFALPPQTSYLFSINGNLTEFERQKADLMDATTVENAIMKRVRQSAYKPGSTPFGFR